MFSRMMELRPGAEDNMMVEVSYRQGRDGTILDTVVQDVYLCASMEFLLTVADIFLKATQQGFAQVPQPKHSSGGDKKNINSSVTSKESSELKKSLINLTSFLSCMAGTDVFLWLSLLLSAAAPAVVSKTEMNVLVRNPEIVFVADLTRADAPALVMTTQCELVMKSGAEGSQMTAVIKDLKVCVVTALLS